MGDSTAPLQGEAAETAQGSVNPEIPKPSRARLEYLGTIAKQLVNELTPILDIKGVTRNTDLLGTFTEAAVTRLVKRVVYPMRVCTGAVIDDPSPEKLLQLDLIMWSPHPAPAIFEVEGFGLVPRSSAFGVLEIKRSAYSQAVVDHIEEVYKAAQDRKIVCSPDGAPYNDWTFVPALGVMTILEKEPTAEQQRLLKEGKAVAIFQQQSETELKPRIKDVFSLVNFLYRVAWRQKAHDGGAHIIQVDTSGLEN